MIAISLCMIVKNEELNLANCLNSISDFVNEIIIVDTGSTDKTKQIALKYTDKVYDYKWNNNFSDARNFSISKASNEYILVLDADEIIKEININKINQLMYENQNKVGCIVCINEYSRVENSYKFITTLSRFFNKNNFCYDGMVHEQVVSITKSNYETYNIPLKIKHTGYDGNLEVRKKKTERNISLLNNALQENPDDPYIIYQLGKSYYMEEDYINACNYLGHALYFDLDTRLEFVLDLVVSYGYSLINTKQYETAMQLINVYDEFSHSADFIFMIAMVLMNNGRFQEAIDEFKKATSKRVCQMEGVNDYLAYYNIGVIYECLGDMFHAKKYYEMCGDYEMALIRMRRIAQFK